MSDIYKRLKQKTKVLGSLQKDLQELAREQVKQIPAGPIKDKILLAQKMARRGDIAGVNKIKKEILNLNNK